MNLSEIIRGISPMSDEGIEMLAKETVAIHISKGELIVEEGQVCNKVYFIRSGLFRNFACNDGEEDTRWFALEGDLIASMYSLAMGQNAIASVVAMTDAEAYVISSDVVYRLISESHEWAEWVSRFFIDGLYVLERRYALWGRGNAEERYRNFMKMRRPIGLVHKIPLKYIASYLGITPQTLSRVRRKLAKETF